MVEPGIFADRRVGGAEPLPERQIAKLRTSVNRGAPFGDEKWTLKTARKLGLMNTINPIGRPKKSEE